MNKCKKILVTGIGNLFNNGEFAMLHSLCQSLLQLRPDINFLVLSSKKSDNEHLIMGEKIKLLDEPFNLISGKALFLFSIIQSILVILYARCTRISPAKEELRVFRDCDLIIDLSGDGISTDYTWLSLYLRLYMVFLGKLAGKKVLLLAQTVGPFKGKINEFVSGIILNMADLIVLRESRSKEVLKRIGVRNLQKIRLTADLAFLLEPRLEDAKKLMIKEGIPQDFSGKLVGLSPSCIIANWFKDELPPQEKQKIYLDDLSGELDNLIDKYGFKLILIPHVMASHSDDLATCREIYERMKHKKSVIMVKHYYNAAVLKAVMGRLRFLIAFRMHAAIGALSMGIPAVCWSYNDKFEGIIAERLGLENYVIDIRKNYIKDAIQKLHDCVSDLEQNYESVKSDIQKEVEIEKREAAVNIEIVLDVLDGVRS